MMAAADKKKNPEKNDQLITVFGRNVLKHRKQRGLTQQALADLCDVDYITISRIERNISNTTISTIAIIAKALDIDPSELLKQD